MKIFFTYSWGDTDQLVKSNFAIAESIFPDIEKISGKDSILGTYRYLSSLANSPFVWIDGDNTIYPAAVEILKATEPSILMTDNEYGIRYGHGGIKRCNPHIPIRNNVIDVTYYLGVQTVDVVGSFHSLGDGWVKIRAIFVEMLKCSLKGENFILHKWITARPDIWKCAHHLLNTSDITHIITLICNRSAFKEYYENNLCNNLQE